MQARSPAEQLFFTTLRVETVKPSGPGTGTAFVVTHIGSDGVERPFAVTCKHVIAGASAGCFWVHLKDGQGNPRLSQPCHLAIQSGFEELWHEHPNPDIDIAVMPIGKVFNMIRSQGREPFLISLPASLIPSPEQWKELDAIEEIHFIGYPNGMFDQRHYLPVARRGTTATPPQVDFDGKPIFLIDASVFPGSSGSPVVVVDAGGYSHRGNFSVGGRAHLLGVVAKVYERTDEGMIKAVAIPTSVDIKLYSKQMIDLGIVFKSTTIYETIADYLRHE